MIIKTNSTIRCNGKTIKVIAIRRRVIRAPSAVPA